VQWSRGDSVLWRSRPAGAVGYLYSANVVKDSAGAVALFQPSGAPGKRRIGRRGGPGGRNLLPNGWDGQHEDFTWQGPGMIRLHPLGDNYSVLRRWDDQVGHYQGWYVNLERSWRRTPFGFDSCDHVLDVVVADDLSTWHLKDEDELAWEVDAGKLSPAQAADIHETADAVFVRIATRAWPFEEQIWSSLSPDASWNMPQIPANWADAFET
jgi:hypothetical protein